MHVNLKDALWIAHPVLELSLAGVMYWRRLHRTFPVFFAYIVFQVLNFLILFPIYQLDQSERNRPRNYAVLLCLLD